MAPRALHDREGRDTYWVTVILRSPATMTERLTLESQRLVKTFIFVTDRNHKKCVLFTVLGLVEPASLGVIMMHEHVHLDGTPFFHAPEARHADMADADLTLENSGWIRQNP